MNASASAVVGVGPQVEADGRSDLKPIEPAVGYQARPVPDGLTGREVQIVLRRRDEAAADPELEQPGIDVDQRTAPGCGHDILAQVVVEVEEEVDVVQHLGELGRGECLPRCRRRSPCPRRP